MNSAYSASLTFANYFDKSGLKPFLYLLFQKMTEGNICIDIDQIDEEVKLEDNNTSHQFNKSILNNHPLIGSSGERKPFIYKNNKLYTQRFEYYEREFANSIISLLSNENISHQQELFLKNKSFVQSLFPNNNTVETDWQFIACISSFIHQFHIITGGPGTGKTTTVSKLLAILLNENPDLKIILTAPTGKAAARLKESQQNIRNLFSSLSINVKESIIDKIENIDALTIHRLLGYIPNSIYFKHNKDNPIDADVIVIDESSMIDIALFYKLMNAIDVTRTKAILLGDRNQLSSIEAGSIFGDVCTSLPSLSGCSKNYIHFFNQFTTCNIIPTKANPNPLFQHITELRHSYRFNENKGIGKLSKAVLHTDINALKDIFESNADDEVSLIHFSEKVIEGFALNLLDKTEGYIYEPNTIQALKKLNNSKILCALKQGKYGTIEINRKIETFIKQHTGGNFNNDLYPNKLIMVTKNQADIGIYNGDIGVVRHFDNEGNDVTLSNNMDNTNRFVCFWKSETECIKILPSNIEQSEPAYALTIHKSQGSEFNKVLIVLPENIESTLITNELIYTAITRAKNKVVIASDEASILSAIKRNVHRISGIKELLN